MSSFKKVILTSAIIGAVVLIISGISFGGQAADQLGSLLGLSAPGISAEPAATDISNSPVPLPVDPEVNGNEISDISADKVAQKFNSAKQIKTKYKLDKTVLKIQPKNKNSVAVTVGDTNIQEFSPNLKLERWEGEISLKIKPDLSAIAKKDKKLSFENDKIIFDTPKITYQLYELPPSEDLNEGGYEYEIDLKEKPVSNVISLDIETTNLDFFYQPPLNQEKYSDADNCTENDCYKDGEIVRHRPENVVGSYAVYHKGGISGDYSASGGKNYRVGKAFHIYRPKIFDSSGQWVWGQLNINAKTGKMTVTIPQDFLDNAVYPVRHAVGATIGYTTAGGGTATIEANIRADNASSTRNGVGANISAYLSGNGTAQTIKYALYVLRVPVTNGQTVIKTKVNGWMTLRFIKNPTIDQSSYTIAAWTNATTGTCLVASDTVNGWVDYTYALAYGAWPDPATWTSNANTRYSIYLTYLEQPSEIILRPGVILKRGPVLK